MVGDRPLVGRTRRRRAVSVRPPTPGRSLASCGSSTPPVVRGFAPPTGGYDASDRKRSSLLRKDARPCVPTRGYSSRFDTTDARPCVPTKVTRLALTQRTHRSCVPTKVTRPVRPDSRYSSRVSRQRLHVSGGNREASGRKRNFPTEERNKSSEE